MKVDNHLSAKAVSVCVHSGRHGVFHQLRRLAHMSSLQNLIESAPGFSARPDSILSLLEIIEDPEVDVDKLLTPPPQGGPEGLDEETKGRIRQRMAEGATPEQIKEEFAGPPPDPEQGGPAQ